MIRAEDVVIPSYLARTLERLASRGEKNPDLARALGLSRYTATRYVALLMEMTDSPTRAALVTWAYSSGWIYAPAAGGVWRSGRWQRESVCPR